MNRVFDYGQPIDVAMTNRVSMWLKDTLPTAVIE